MNRIRFDIRIRADLGNVEEVVPVIDDVDLTDRIHRFERDAGMETRAVSYGGLIPAFYRCAPLRRHFLGTTDTQRVPLLGCSCGECGCWPLVATITVDTEFVRWDRFAQPFRHERDNGAVGPFTFLRTRYEEALRALDALT